MKRRRISAAFVELDSEQVIRAKDEEASQVKVLASSRNQNRSSPRIASKAGALAEKDLGGSKEPSKEGHHTTDSGQDASFCTRPIDDSSHLADIAYKAGGTEHAMPTASHQTEIHSSSLSVARKSVDRYNQQQSTPDLISTFDVKPQHQRRRMVTRSVSATSNHDDNPKQTNNPGVLSSARNTNDPSQPGALTKHYKSTLPSMQTRLISSRPRRSTRKRHTLQKNPEVDWSEDLRPTDEEDSFQNGVNGGETSISSADLEVTNSLDRKGKRRQKVFKSQAGSRIRRKTAGRNALGKDANHTILQLPLTAVPLDDLQAEPSRPNAGLTPVKPNLLDMIDTTDAPDFTLPVIEKREPRKTELATNQQIPIMISSCLPNVCDQPMTETDAETSGIEQPPLPGNQSGRGKAVGEKLADALRGSKSVPPVRRALGKGPHSTRMSDIAPIGRKSPDLTVTQAHSTRITRSQLPQGLKIGVVQVNRTSSDVYGEPSNPAPSRLLLDRQLLSKRTEAHTEAADMAAHGPLLTRKRLKSMESTGLETGRDGASICTGIPEGYPPISLFSAHAANKPSAMLTNNQKEPEKDPGLFGSETGVSSQNSAESEIDPLEALFVPEDENGHTPDSQKPLLTDRPQTPVPDNASFPLGHRSTRRSCAVDHNGSPRLKPQVTTSTSQSQPHLEMNRLRAMIGMSDSSSIYSYSSDDEQSLEVYSLEHQPVSRPIWTKFQRDMFKEYGIEAEELIKQKTKPFLFSGNVKNDAYPKIIEDQQLLEMQPVGSPPRNDKATSGETNTHSIIQEKSPEGPWSVSQRSIDDPSQISDQQRDEVPNENRNQSKSCPTPVPLMEQGYPESMEWISALKTAQQTAHDQLLETNQVSVID